MQFLRVDGHIVNLRHLVDISKSKYEGDDGQTVYYINFKTTVTFFSVKFETKEERNESFERLSNDLD